jgi:hypothetical protein
MIVIHRSKSNFPQVFCQRLDHNELICSLMSSIFQRRIDSPQHRVEHTRRNNNDDNVTTMTDGNFIRRNHNGYGDYAIILLIVVESNPSTESHVPIIIERAKNRGFTLVHLTWNNTLAHNQEDLR